MCIFVFFAVTVGCVLFYS